MWQWVVELLLGLIQLIVEGVTNLVPVMPGWFTEGLDGVSSAVNWARQLDHWLPVDEALIAGGVVLACYGVSVVIGIIRVVVSYMTFGGGAT